MGSGVPIRPVLAIHAGAGRRSQELRDRGEECLDVLREALQAGASALQRGLDAITAAQAAVVVLEDFELFNAGRGSTLCADGSVEMSAALMRGTDRAAGAVAMVRHTQNPILGARAVLDSPQVLMVGSAADQRAVETGIRQQPQGYFVTERELERLRAVQAAGPPPPAPGPPPAGRPSTGRATVGAVCLDSAGQLAAATSTGGIRGQPPGRVGDCPVIGAGTWADRVAAISCTGDGEAFIRCATAREVAALVAQGVPLAQAAPRALAQVTELGYSGGLVAVDAEGQAAMPFTTEMMPRGLWRPGDPPSATVG